MSTKPCADQNVLAKTIVAATDTANPEIQIFFKPTITILKTIIWLDQPLSYKYHRYQEELSHFPQKSAFYAPGSVIWRFEVPGRTVTFSTQFER